MAAYDVFAHAGDTGAVEIVASRRAGGHVTDGKEGAMVDAISDEAPDPGDLGRRVRERRERLGLGLVELAARAGMAPGYLDYVERRAGASPSSAAVTRLAAALETTVSALHGGGLAHPPGAGREAEARPVLEMLDEDQCLRLLGPGGVGRVVFDEARGPVAFPVNFALADGHVVLHTGDGSITAAARSTGHLSFEVDQLDEALGEGWSVLVVGRATVAPEAAGGGREAGNEPVPDPWAGGDRHEVVRILLDEVTGRRIRHRR